MKRPLIKRSNSHIYHRNNHIYHRRNVFDALFVYPTLSMKKQDRLWRIKVHMCLYIDPVEYAVEPKFLGRRKKEVGRCRDLCRG